MQTLSWTTVDKTAWGKGPWQDEPDKKQWQDPETGLPCLIVRNSAGALCGYVGVSESHPLFEQKYHVGYERGIDVHGGLTFSDTCNEEAPPEKSICRVAEEGGPVWWFGFDCAHGFDFGPAIVALVGGDGYGTYRTLQYVEDNCAHLARQLKALEA